MIDITIKDGKYKVSVSQLSILYTADKKYTNTYSYSELVDGKILICGDKCRTTYTKNIEEEVNGLLLDLNKMVKTKSDF